MPLPRAASLRDGKRRRGSWLLQVAHQRDDLDPEPTDWIHDHIVSSEDDYIGLCAAAADVDAGVPCFVRKHQYTHRKALGVAQPPLVGRLRRQLPVRSLVPLADAPANAMNASPEYLARQHV